MRGCKAERKRKAWHQRKPLRNEIDSVLEKINKLVRAWTISWDTAINNLPTPKRRVHEAETAAP